MTSSTFRSRCQKDTTSSLWLLQNMDLIDIMDPAQAMTDSLKLRQYCLLRLKEAGLVLNPKKTAKPTDEPSQVQKFFYLSYNNVFGKPYVAAFAKDYAIFRDILALIPLSEVIGLIEQFFATEDPFIRKCGYTTGVFKSQINKLRNPITEQDAIAKQAGIL